MWDLDPKEDWAPKNWCFWTVVLEKTLESLLGAKVITQVISKINQSWIFIARTDFKVEAPILWPPYVKSWLIRTYPKDWREEEKGTTEEEMIVWHHWLNGHEFEQVQGSGTGQGSLACCSPEGCKEPHMTEPLNHNKANKYWLSTGWQETHDANTS